MACPVPSWTEPSSCYLSSRPVSQARPLGLEVGWEFAKFTSKWWAQVRLKSHYVISPDTRVAGTSFLQC